MESVTPKKKERRGEDRDLLCNKKEMRAGSISEGLPGKEKQTDW